MKACVGGRTFHFYFNIHNDWNILCSKWQPTFDLVDSKVVAQNRFNSWLNDRHNFWVDNLINDSLDTFFSVPVVMLENGIILVYHKKRSKPVDISLPRVSNYGYTFFGNLRVYFGPKTQRTATSKMVLTIYPENMHRNLELREAQEKYYFSLAFTGNRN